MTKRERRYHNRKTWWEEFKEIDRAFWSGKINPTGKTVRKCSCSWVSCNGNHGVNEIEHVTQINIK